MQGCLESFTTTTVSGWVGISKKYYTDGSDVDILVQTPSNTISIGKAKSTRKDVCSESNIGLGFSIRLTDSVSEVLRRLDIPDLQIIAKHGDHTAQLRILRHVRLAMEFNRLSPSECKAVLGRLEGTAAATIADHFKSEVDVFVPTQKKPSHFA